MYSNLNLKQRFVKLSNNSAQPNKLRHFVCSMVALSPHCMRVMGTILRDREREREREREKERESNASTSERKFTLNGKYVLPFRVNGNNVLPLR